MCTTGASNPPVRSILSQTTPCVKEGVPVDSKEGSHGIMTSPGPRGGLRAPALIECSFLCSCRNRTVVLGCSMFSVERAPFFPTRHKTRRFVGVVAMQGRSAAGRPGSRSSKSNPVITAVGVFAGGGGGRGGQVYTMTFYLTINRHTFLDVWRHGGQDTGGPIPRLLCTSFYAQECERKPAISSRKSFERSRRGRGQAR